jgi:hypothetical protein
MLARLIFIRPDSKLILAHMLKNGVGTLTVGITSFFYFYTKLFFINKHFARAQTLSRMSLLSGRMNIRRANIEFFPGWKEIRL